MSTLSTKSRYLAESTDASKSQSNDSYKPQSRYLASGTGSTKTYINKETVFTTPDSCDPTKFVVETFTHGGPTAANPLIKVQYYGKVYYIDDAGEKTIPVFEIGDLRLQYPGGFPPREGEQETMNSIGPVAYMEKIGKTLNGSIQIVMRGKENVEILTEWLLLFEQIELNITKHTLLATDAGGFRMFSNVLKQVSSSEMRDLDKALPNRMETITSSDGFTGLLKAPNKKKQVEGKWVTLKGDKDYSLTFLRIGLPFPWIRSGGGSTRDITKINTEIGILDNGEIRKCACVPTNSVAAFFGAGDKANVRFSIQQVRVHESGFAIETALLKYTRLEKGAVSTSSVASEGTYVPSEYSVKQKSSSSASSSLADDPYAAGDDSATASSSASSSVAASHGDIPISAPTKTAKAPPAAKVATTTAAAPAPAPAAAPLRVPAQDPVALATTTTAAAVSAAPASTPVAASATAPPRQRPLYPRPPVGAAQSQ